MSSISRISKLFGPARQKMWVKAPARKMTTKQDYRPNEKGTSHYMAEHVYIDTHTSQKLYILLFGRGGTFLFMTGRGH
jgi:hypothetical protein